MSLSQGHTRSPSTALATSQGDKDSSSAEQWFPAFPSRGTRELIPKILQHVKLLLADLTRTIGLTVTDSHGGLLCWLLAFLELTT